MTRQSLEFWNSQLQNTKTIPDFDAWPDRYAALSKDAARYGAPERIATGPDEMQAVWRVATGRPSHAFVFIHGGYWRRFSAADFGFVAAAAAAADATYYNVDYRLMPGVRMAEVVGDVVKGVAHAADNASHVVVVGHSAGGHLAAEAALRLATPPAACVSISGLFELEPLRASFIQDEIGLTDEEVAAYSTQSRAGEFGCPVHLIAGGDETVEFRRQSARLYDAIAQHGGTASLHFEPGHHHTSVAAELAKEDSPLTRRIAALFGTA